MAQRIQRVKGYWCSRENQRKYVNELIQHYNLKDVTELKYLKKKQILHFSGSGFLEYFNNDLEKAYSTLFPHYEWNFKRNKPRGYWKNRTNQYKFLETLYIQRKFQSLEELQNISNQELCREEGGGLLNLASSITELLCTLYPNYPWNITIKYPKSYWQEIENQREFLDRLYRENNFERMEQFCSINYRKILQLGGKGFLEYYGYNIAIGILYCYPHFPWNFALLKVKERRKEKQSKNDEEEEGLKSEQIQMKYWADKENQKRYLDLIYNYLQLKSIDDWRKISRTKFISVGGKMLLKYYRGDLAALLSANYPSHHFESKSKKSTRWTSIVKIQNYFDELYKKLNLTSMEDWKRVRKSELVKRNGGSLLAHFNQNLKALLKFTYPNYCWAEKANQAISPKLLKSKSFWRSIDNQRRFCDQLYTHLNFTSLDDWKNVKNDVIIAHSGKHLLFLYHSNFQFALIKIYPNFPWNFADEMRSTGRRKWLRTHGGRMWRSIDYQKQFLENLFEKLNFKNESDWEMINEKILLENGGKILFDLYSKSLSLLFSTLYPHLNLNFQEKQTNHLKRFLLHVQSNFMIRRKGDWERISIDLLRQIGRHSSFSHPSLSHFSSPSSQFIFNMKNCNNIKQKTIEKNNIISILRHVHPSLDWHSSPFCTAKSTQRWLFVSLHSILSFSPFLSLPPHHSSTHPLRYNNKEIIEEYHHPKLIRKSGSSIELDLFIPSLNIGIEYQGEQHYNENIGHFGSLDMYKDRDFEKLHICDHHSVHLLEIPYWWDRSPNSLFSTFSAFLYSILSAKPSSSL